MMALFCVMHCNNLHLSSHRSNLDPFTQYCEESVWDALERTHMKECVSVYNTNQQTKKANASI